VLNHSIPITGLAPSTTYEYRVTSKDAGGRSATWAPTPLPTFMTLAPPDTTPPIVVFTSPQTATSQGYTLTYTVDGIGRSETWRLGSGENHLVVRAEDQAGNETTAVHRVSWTAATVPDPDPVVPSNDSIVSITTAGGFVLKYENGNLLAIEKPLEYTLESLQFDIDTGNLEGGLIKYLTGSEIYYHDNLAIWWKDPQGARYYFNADGLVREILAPDDVKTVFSYQNDASNQVQFVTAAGVDVTSLYNAERKLLKTIKTNDDTTSYDDGVLQSIKLASGQVINYTKTLLASGAQVTLSSSAPNIYPTSITYDLNGQITEVLKQSAVRILFQGGLPSQVIDRNGVASDYDFTTNPLGDFIGFRINRLDYAHRFDNEGHLTWLKTPEAEFGILNGVIQSLTVLEEQTAGIPQGAIVRFEETDNGKQTIVTYPAPDARVLVYRHDETLAKDVLREVTLADGTIQTFLPDGTLESFQTADGKFYEYQRTPEGGFALLKRWQLSDGRVLYFEPASGSPTSPTLDRVGFPDGRTLESIVLDIEGRIGQADETVVDEHRALLYTNHYESGTLRKRTYVDNSYLIFQADGSVDTFTDTSDGTYRVSYENCVQGECSTIKLESASEVFLYSADGTILSYMTGGLAFEFDEMGVVKHVKTSFGEIESPVWDQTGKLVGGKVTLADETQYLIENGFISQMNSPDGSEVIYEEGYIDQITDEGEILRFEYLRNGLQELEQVMMERNADQTVTNDGLINFLIHPERFDAARLFFASPIQNLLATPHVDTNISVVTKVPSLREVLAHCTPSCTPTWYEFVYDQVAQPEVVEVLAPAPNPALNEWNIGFLDVPPMYELAGPYAFASSGATVENVRGVPSDLHKIQYDLTNPGTFVGHYYLSYQPPDTGALVCIKAEGDPTGPCIGYKSSEEIAREKTVDLSQAQYLALGLKGNPGTVVVVELTDINQNRHRVLLRGIDSEERFFRIDFTEFSDIDLTKIRSLAFILESDRQMVKQGTLELSYLSFKDRHALKFPEPNLNQESGEELPSFQSIGLETWRVSQWPSLESYPNPGNRINYSTDSEIDFHFDGPSDKGTQTEVVFNYDQPDTELSEYQDLSGLSHLILGAEIKNYGGYNQNRIYFILEDADGNKWQQMLKLETSGPNFYLLDLNEVAIDLKRIRSIRFAFMAGYSIDNKGDGHVWLRGIPRDGPIPYALPNVETDQVYLLPNEKMSVSLTDTDFSRYDFINLSIKAPENATDSKAMLTMGSSSYTTRTLSPGWNHLIIPLSKFSSTEGDALEVEFEGSTQSGYFIDNLVFFRFRGNGVESLYPKLSVSDSSIRMGYSRPWQSRDESFGQLIPQFRDGFLGPKHFLFGLGALLTVETRIRYDMDGSISQIETGDGRTLMLRGDELDETVLPGGNILDYQYDAQGNLESVVLIESESGVQPTTVSNAAANYRYEKIREVRRPDGSRLEYSYEFVKRSQLRDWLIYAGQIPTDDDSNDPPTDLVEITVVRVPIGTVPESYEIKRYSRDPGSPYQTGQLLSVVDPNNLVTVYEYQDQKPQAPLKASRTYYNGRLQSESTHEYREVEIDDPTNPGNLIKVIHTFITDEEGTESEYDADGDLIRHTTSDGYKYEHLLEEENYVVFNGAVYLEGKLFRLEAADFTMEEAVTDDSGVLIGSLLLYPDGHRTFFVDGKPDLTTRDVGKPIFFDEARDAGTELYDIEAANFALAQRRWSETSKTLPQEVTPEQVEIVRLISRQTDQAYAEYDEGKLTALQLKDIGLHVSGIELDEAGFLKGATVKREDNSLYKFREGLHFERTNAEGTVDQWIPQNEAEEYLKESERWMNFKGQVASFIRSPNESGASKKTSLGTGYYSESGRLLEVHLRAEGVTLKELEFDDDGELVAAKAVFQGNVTARYRDELSVSIWKMGIKKVWIIPIPVFIWEPLSYFDSGNLQYETLKSNWNEWKEDISEYLLDPVFVIETEYDTDGTITTISKADRSVSLYENGKVDQVFSFEGRLLIHYTYDPDDETLISVALVDARKRLEEDTDEARREIARQKVLALEELAERTNLAIEQLKNEVEQQRQVLLGHRSTLEQHLADLENKKISGRNAKKAKSGALDQIRGAINQVNGALAELDQKLAEGIEEISDKAREVSEQIRTESEAALDNVEAKRTEYLNEILKQELTPILHDIYRNALGRDPSESETQQAMAQKEAGLFDPHVLRGVLFQSDEYHRRLVQVNQIKSEVTNALNQYLQGAYSVSEELGLSLDEVVSLSQPEIDQVIRWLNSHDLHFGHSAFLALQTLLESEGKPVSEIELAEKAILIDILTGVITPFEEGELKLSLHALERVASKYGVVLYPAEISYEELKAMVLSGKKVIVHLSGDHYSIVTGFETTTQTQIVFRDGQQVEIEIQVEKVITLERNKGEFGEEVLLTKDQFLGAWAQKSGERGYVLTPIEVNPEGDGRVLSRTEAQSVRGAFFFFIGFIIAAIIAAIQAVIAVVIAAVLAVIAAVSAVISAVIGAISGLVSAIGNGLTLLAKGLKFFGKFLFDGIRGAGRILFKGLQFVGSKLYQGLKTLGSFLKDAAINLGGKLRSGIAKVGATLAKGVTRIFSSLDLAKLYSFQSGATSLKASLIKNAVGFALNFAVNKGLDSLGIEVPGINILTSIVTGGIAGFVEETTTTGFITGALQKLALQGVSTLALHLDLPPPIASALSSVTALITGNFDHLPDAFREIGSTVLQQLALSGITALGEAIGLDPRITALIGIPIRSTLVGLVNGLGSGNSIFQSIKDSLLSSQTLGGLVSVGASIGLDAIGAPPILQSFVPGILSQLVSGASGSTGGGGGPGPDGVTNDGRSLFDKVSETFSKFGGGIVSAIGSAVGNVVSFGQKVLEGVGSITKAGFGKAVDFFSNVFSRQTIEKLITIGSGSIQSAIEQFANITANGIEFIKNGVSIIWNPATDAFSYVDGAIRGVFDKLSVDSIGKFFSGAIDIGRELTDGIFLDQTIENSNQNIHLKDGQGNSLFRIIGQAGKAIFNSAGGIVNGIVEGINGFLNIVIDGGKVVATNIKNGAKVAWDTL
ncbi:MAG: hypothetical protein HY584_05780, partial [Candidatus Omnitrophica bacterium]|nr:hypothetical protein [Candidatus Omnitrophota bacterium]